MDIAYVLGLGGVVVFAATGCLAGGAKKMDLFGVLVVGVVTSLGGGTLRDLVLDRPVFWAADNANLFAAAASVVVTFIAVRYRPAPANALKILDACGLSLFTVTGAEIALNAGSTPLVAVILGTMTAVAGGVTRDVLCNDVPKIFVVGELYATPAICGAAAYVALVAWGLEGGLPLILGGVLALAFRLAAIRWKLSLPAFRDSSAN